MTDQTPDETIRQAQGMMRTGRFVDAAKMLANLLEDHPDHVDGLYCLAVCQRKQDRVEDALHTLDRLNATAPKYGHGFQERGFVHQALSNHAEAIDAFDKAVTLNPALHASWRVLADVKTYPRREEATLQLNWLTGLPPELVSVTSFLHQDKLHKAEQLCRKFLQKTPHHPEAMRLLAEIGSKFKVYDDAEFLLESCLEFEPDFVRARLDYVGVLHHRQKFDKALEHARRLNEIDPGNATFEISLANAEAATGDFEGAVKTYETVLARMSDLHTVHAAKGHALKTIGYVNDAIAAYRAAYSAKADYGDAYWSLANLKTYRFLDSELDQMRVLEASTSTSDEDRAHLCFALGKALEDQHDFAASFEYYERGNALKRKSAPYQGERTEADLTYQKTHFDADFFRAREGFGTAAPDPIFIVGLPRAGSTLLEQILASHSMVDGTMELSNIIAIAHRMNGRELVKGEPNYPAILGTLGRDKLTSLGNKYIEETQHHRSGARFFIDKMPNNFRHIALIQLMLPNAKIIDARREPMSCCFSGFKQLFAEGQEFTYGLEDVAHYYRSYVDIMDHWDEVMPKRILRVQHEDIITDLETQVRRILTYCGLPFEQACLDFHQTKRAVRTPSSEQVRQPVYTSGMDQWRNYEAFLTPLKTALGPCLNDTGV
ncbi:MAG: sulfotransferase [Pseudomonadota bacterium]